MIKSGFFNAVNGDRVYNAADIGRYLHSIVGSGVFPTPGSSLQVLAGTGLNIEIQPGRAMLDYHYMENDSAMTLTLAAGGTMPRIDAVVARLSLENRLCEIAVKQGTPAVSPVRPTMTRSDTTKEYMLASIRVEKLASAITQENITDTRADSTVCGWVTGLIDQVDTSALFAQFQAAYEARLKAWDEFMESLTGELTVQTYVQEYRNMITLTEDSDTLAVGIDDYEAGVDVLMVNYRGLLLMEGLEYTVSGTGSTATVNLTDPRREGETIEFRVLKSKVGYADQASTLLLGDEGTLLTDGGAALSL